MPHLHALHLSDFRNYDKLDLELVPGLNLLVGANGQGKTNLLEAIQFLSLLRSFRTTRLSHLHRWGTRLFRLRGELSTDHGERRLAVEHGPQRRLMVDGSLVSRASDFIRHFCCNTFVPEDIGLVKGTGSDRRRFLDMLTTQLVPGCMPLLQEYAHTLKARNALLRHPQPSDAAIRAYDKVLIDRGASLMIHRATLLANLAERLRTVGSQLFSAEQRLTLEYLPSIRLALQQPPPEALRQAFQEELNAHRQQDLARQHTTRGPHRDEIRLALDDHPLDLYGSEGQCRLAVLALKMAAGDLLIADTRELPIIWLVDDVVGELDARARHAFYEHLRRADQTFLVATGDHALAELSPAIVFNVDSGRILAST